MRRSSNKILLNYFSDASMLAAPVKGCLLKIACSCILAFWHREVHTYTRTQPETLTRRVRAREMDTERVKNARFSDLCVT